MTTKSKIIAAGLAVVFTSSTAYAEEGFYLGAGLSYGHMATSLATGPFANSADEYGSATIIGGYRTDVENKFWAAELQLEVPLGDKLIGAGAGTTCAVGAVGPYGCEVDAVVRLRGVFGGEIASGLELYGTAGFVAVMGEGANSPTSQDSVITGGFSAGIGLQKAFTPSLKLRGEINHDIAKIGINQANGALNGPTCCDVNFEQTSVQVSLVKSF